MAIGDGGILATNVTVIAKVEGTYGTTPTPTADDAVLVDLFAAPGLNLETHPKRCADGSYLPRPSHRGARSWDFSLVFDLRGSGTAGTPGEQSPLLQMCGLKETDGAGDDTYTPDLTDKKSAEVDIYLGDNTKFVSLGTRGVFSMACEGSGQPLKFTAACRGIYAEPTNAASPGSETYDATVAPVFLGGTFTAFGGSLKIRSFSIDSGAKLAEQRTGTAATGFYGFLLTEWNPTGQLVVELDSEADLNWWDTAVDATTGVWDMTFGATAGNKFDIDLPDCRVESVEIGEEEGLAIATLGLTFHETASPWITLKYY